MNSDVPPEGQGSVENLSNPRDIVAEVYDWWAQIWRKLVGTSFVDDILQDRKKAEQLLGHADPKVRCAALSLLETHWNAAGTAAFPKKCEEIAFRDPDPEVRGLALSVLGLCYMNIPYARIGKLLAEVVLNDAEPPKARVGAYFGLCHFRGRRPRWAGEFTGAPFRMPADVNWPFVMSLIDSSR